VSTSEKTRDPRLDPRTGDEIESTTETYGRGRAKVVRRVEAVIDGYVAFTETEWAVKHVRTRTVAQWRDWAAGGRVVRASGASS
jgi:hypothetical protein